MKSNVLKTLGINMCTFCQKSSIYRNLLICIVFGMAISGCTTPLGTGIFASASAISTGLLSTNENLKFSIKRAFSRAKKWGINSNIKRSGDKDLEFAIQQYNQNNFEVAEFYLKKVLVKVPDNSIAIKRLPWVYFYQKKYNKALRAFERTRINYPKNPQPLIGMGWSYFGLRQY